jgi:hypothetical protein
VDPASTILWAVGAIVALGVLVPIMLAASALLPDSPRRPRGLRRAVAGALALVLWLALGVAGWSVGPAMAPGDGPAEGTRVTVADDLSVRYARTLDDALTTLNERRQHLRTKLASAGTRVAQAKLATDLQRAFLGARIKLRRVGPPLAESDLDARIQATLQATAVAYGRLARTARLADGRRVQFARWAQRAERGEQALRAALRQRAVRRYVIDQ